MRFVLLPLLFDYNCVNVDHNCVRIDLSSVSLPRNALSLRHISILYYDLWAYHWRHFRVHPLRWKHIYRHSWS